MLNVLDLDRLELASNQDVATDDANDKGDNNGVVGDSDVVGSVTHVLVKQVEVTGEVQCAPSQQLGLKTGCMAGWKGAQA